MHRIQDDGGDQGIASGRSKQFCGASSSGAAHGMNQPPPSTDPSTPRSLSLSLKQSNHCNLRQLPISVALRRLSAKDTTDNQSQRCSSPALTADRTYAGKLSSQDRHRQEQNAPSTVKSRKANENARFLQTPYDSIAPTANRQGPYTPQFPTASSVSFTGSIKQLPVRRTEAADEEEKIPCGGLKEGRRPTAAASESMPHERFG